MWCFWCFFKIKIDQIANSKRHELLLNSFSINTFTYIIKKSYFKINNFSAGSLFDRFAYLLKAGI